MDGLEIKVQLGSVWKQSLTELSGGQRCAGFHPPFLSAHSHLTPLIPRTRISIYSTRIHKARSSHYRSSWRCYNSSPRRCTSSTRSTQPWTSRTRNTSARSSARGSTARSSSSCVRRSAAFLRYIIMLSTSGKRIRLDRRRLWVRRGEHGEGLRREPYEWRVSRRGVRRMCCFSVACIVCCFTLALYSYSIDPYMYLCPCNADSIALKTLIPMGH